MTPEQKVKTSVRNILKKIEHCEFNNDLVTGDNGSPDVKGHIEGYYFSFEIKKDENTKPRKLQMYRINKTNRFGGFSRCIGSRAQLLQALEEFEKIKGFKIFWKE